MRTKPGRIHRGLLFFGVALALGASASVTRRAHADDDANRKLVTINTTPEAGPVAIDDDDPERSVLDPESAMKHPLQMGYLVMQFLERGQKASERGDAKSAVRYYRALVKAMPERATAYGLLCDAYRALGDVNSALEACRTALGRPGATLDDNVHFVELVISLEGTLEKRHVEDVDAVIAHLQKELASDKAALLTAQQLQCSLAARLEDEARLEACSTRLEQLAPKDPSSVAYAFALQLKKRDFVAAQALIARAQRLGLPLEATDKMKASLSRLRDERTVWQRWLANWGLVGGLTLLLSVVAGFLSFSRRRSGFRSEHGPQPT